jgi:hypothetical protein
VLRRMDQVLEQLPKARQQARQRILSGQLTDNKEKILSLYEGEVRVIVRKKAGAEVEFGNTLLLGENPQGLILDWELFRETAPADSRLLQRSVRRMSAVFGPVPVVIGKLLVESSRRLVYPCLSVGAELRNVLRRIVARLSRNCNLYKIAGTGLLSGWPTPLL